MRPPVCRLCDRDFDPTEEGGIVSFRAPEEPWWTGRVDEEEVERHGPPTGHPSHVEWFCGRHVEAARELSHLKKAQALTRLRGEGAGEDPPEAESHGS